MPGRKPGSANKRTLEFFQQYDALVKKYGDPIEAAFKLKNSRKHSIKLGAISLLLQYRYPKLAAVAIVDDTADQLTLSWGEPESLEAPDLSDLQIPGITIEGKVVAE